MRAMQHATFFKFFSNTDKSAASRGISVKFSVPLCLLQAEEAGWTYSRRQINIDWGTWWNPGFAKFQRSKSGPLCHRTKYKVSLCLLNQLSTFCLSSTTAIEQWEKTILLCPHPGFQPKLCRSPWNDRCRRRFLPWSMLKVIKEIMVN